MLPADTNTQLFSAVMILQSFIIVVSMQLLKKELIHNGMLQNVTIKKGAFQNGMLHNGTF
jgi:hypothetical protein